MIAAANLWKMRSIWEPLLFTNRLHSLVSGPRENSSVTYAKGSKDYTGKSLVAGLCY